MTVLHCFNDHIGSTTHDSFPDSMVRYHFQHFLGMLHVDKMKRVQKNGSQGSSITAFTHKLLYDIPINSMQAILIMNTIHLPPQILKNQEYAFTVITNFNRRIATSSSLHSALLHTFDIFIINCIQSRNKFLGRLSLSP